MSSGATSLRRAPTAAEVDWPAGLTPFDPFDHAVQADPYAHYAWMRKAAPVLRAETADGPAYFVSRFRDVTAGLRDAGAFASNPRTGRVPPGFLLNIDPPEHAALRGTTSRAFSPRAVAALEQPIAALVEARWRAFLATGGGDAIAAFASPLTIAVISTVMGVPVERAEQMREWTTGMLEWLAVQLRGVSASSAVSDQAYRKLTGYMDQVLQAALASPEENVVGNLARLRAEGALSPEETTGFVTLMFAAGHETTTLLTGNCLDHLCDHPEWLALLRQEGGAAAFANEMLRFRPPVHRLTRYVHEEAEIGGYRIPAGSSVRFLVASANRDEEAFPDPDRFDPSRNVSAHAAFGYGMHMCMGSWLAKLEVRLILATIGQTVARIERDPAIPSVPLTGGAFATVGLSSLGVRLATRAAA